MIPFFKYTVEENTHFVAVDYPYVVEELASIKKKLSTLPLQHRTDIFISFFKNHMAVLPMIHCRKKLKMMICMTLPQ